MLEQPLCKHGIAATRLYTYTAMACRAVLSSMSPLETFSHSMVYIYGNSMVNLWFTTKSIVVVYLIQYKINDDHLIRFDHFQLNK